MRAYWSSFGRYGNAVTNLVVSSTLLQADLGPPADDAALVPLHADISMKPPSFLARKTLGQPNYFLLAMAMVFLVAFIPRGARKAVESNNNKAEDWLPPNYSESIDLRWFRDYFIGEQFALVSWDGCTLGDTEKLRRLSKRLIPSEQELAKADPDSDVHQRAAWYSHLITGPAVLDQLTSSPLSLSYGEAVKRIEGALVGPVKRDANGKSLGHESRATCLIVYLSEEATRDNRTMRKAIEHITEIASTECAIKEDAIHMGGPPVDNITIDVEGERTLVRLALLSGIVGLSLSYWCFRSMKLTSIVFAVGVLSAGMSLAIVFYFGIAEVMFMGFTSPHLGTVDAILMSMPAVVYVLGLSGAIHIVNYYRDARRESGVAGAAETAVRFGWGPCALAAFTTAVGLGSLYTSDILPIKKFGMFTAIAVMATVGLLFTILPVFLHRFPVSEELVKRQSGGGHDESHLPGWARRLFGYVVGHPVLTCVFWFVVMGTLSIGFTRIDTTVSLLKLLDPDTDLIHDYAWLENNLGNLVPMEVVLTIPPERLRTPDEHAESDGQQYRMTMLEELNMVRMIQHRIETLPEISRVMSVATYTPKNTNSGITSADLSADYATNKSLEENRQTLMESGYLQVENTAEGKDAPAGRELWRVSARVAALGEDDEGVDYGEFVQQLKQAVDPVLVAFEQRDQIIAKLNESGKRLDGAKLCVLYRSPNGEFPENSQEAVLKELLTKSGSKIRGVSTYNLADLDSRKTDSKYAKYLQALIKKLGDQDALILASASSDPTAKQLVEGGLSVIDVTQVFDHEGSAVTPLAVGDQPRPIRAVYTGMIPLVFKTQRQLLLSLSDSIMWATLLISVVMMFVLRSPLAGLVSMIPNVFPIVIIFGSLGWLGIKVDIGIMMTASVALGVAVDDTVHFLTWFRRGVAQGMNRVQAVMLSYDRCATAMLQTTIIGGLGLAMFATSTFTPTQQFGYLMISMLAIALIGDLLLLPAILVSPLGRVFGGKAPAKSKPSGEIASPQAVLDEKVVAPPASSPASTIEAEAISEPPISVPPAEQPPTYSSADFRQDMQEGPHAALHAKLRSLRREHPQDPISSK